MIEYFYVKKSYVDWLKYFLDSNNGFIRTSDDDYFKNITEEDDRNANELFMFFRRLLSYSKKHDIASNVLEKEIYDKYGDTYMCFDCSLVFKYKCTLINMVVLELGGASDMIVRTINNINVVHCKNIINIDDFYHWLNDYEYGSISCSNCSNLIAVDADYKVHGIDYKCEFYNEMCNKEYGFLAKNDSRIHPCPTCRRNNHIKFSEKHL